MRSVRARRADMARQAIPPPGSANSADPASLLPVALVCVVLIASVVVSAVKLRRRGPSVDRALHQGPFIPESDSPKLHDVTTETKWNPGARCWHLVTAAVTVLAAGAVVAWLLQPVPALHLQFCGHPWRTAAAADVFRSRAADSQLFRSFAVSSVPACQQLFNAGLVLAFSFNHVQAVRMFRAALQHDPGCVDCAWGVAYALGPYVNKV